MPAAILGDNPAASIAFSAVAAVGVSLLSPFIFLILNIRFGKDHERYMPW